jgi:chaperonin GroES
MKIRPLHDRVIVKRVEESESKQGMLYIPDSAKEKPQQGEVGAVGTGRLSDTGERVPMEVKPGDRILFGKYGGSEVRVDGEDWLILREDEILGVLE